MKQLQSFNKISSHVSCVDIGPSENELRDESGKGYIKRLARFNKHAGFFSGSVTAAIS